MSSQQQFTSSSDQLSLRKDKSNPDCPQCNREMTVKQVSPVLFATDLDDVIYGCAACGAELKRTVKRT